MQVSVTNGGAMESAAAGEVFSTFRVMSNELSTPLILVCPGDRTRLPAQSFTTNFADANLSYFIGIDVTNSMWQAFSSGDRNLSANGSAVKHGLHEFSTNQILGWTGEFHGDWGNVCLGDGSVQVVSAAGLNDALRNTGLATNRLAVP
jgi:prepilin-type processing-associated H-X9-DG protein